MPRKVFIPLGGSNHLCLECASTCHVRNSHLENQINSFFMCDTGIYIFEKAQKTSEYVIGVVSSPSKFCAKQNCFPVQTWQESGERCHKCPQSKANVRKTQTNRKLLGSDRSFCSAKKTSRIYEAKKFPTRFRSIIATNSYTQTHANKAGINSFLAKLCRSPICWWKEQELQTSFLFVPTELTFQQQDPLSFQRRYPVKSRSRIKFN